MVLGNWLLFFEARLKLASMYRRRSRLRRPRRGYIGGAPLVCFAAAAEVLEYRQLLAAAVTAVSPNTATPSGGTQVSIVGSGFTGVQAIMFGSTAATGFNVNSSTSITAMSPSHSAGQVDIIVMASSGNSSANSADHFTFQTAGPQVTQVGPSTGSTAGGTAITITGSGFSSVSAVMFGTTAASSFSATSSTSITAVAPAHTAGAVDVIVVTSAGSSTVNPSQDQFTYAATGPTVTSLSTGTGTGSGGTSVTITGTNFSNVSNVLFGSTAAASYTVVSPTQITAVSPSHNPGTVDVTVVASAGTSATSSADQYVFTTPVVAPQVTSLVTTSGTTAGGTSVVIQGVNFTNITGVAFGGQAAASYTVNSPTSITAITAPGSAGIVDVLVTNTAGTSIVSSADKFTFQSPAPVVTGLNYTTGSTSGGTAVTIAGSNFVGVSQVYFGSVVSSSVVLNSPTSITAYTPAEGAGVIDVTVQTPSGTSVVSNADKFTFVIPPPVVAALSVASGLTTGGTAVTITGSNFNGATAVSFGGVAAAAFTVVNNSSITAVTPVLPAGVVDVVVTTAGGNSNTSVADQFTALVPPPTVTQLSTSTGATVGGTTVVITGTNFANVIGVSFGSVAAGYYQVNSPTSITAVATAQSAGTVDVTVTTLSGMSATSSADQFTFQDSSGSTGGGSTGGGTTGGSSGSSSTAVPTLLSLETTTGSTTGGDAVTIFGTNLSAVTAVYFGSVAASAFTINSDGAIVATTPNVGQVSNLPGTVDVTLQNANGTSALTPADQFTFSAPGGTPTITGLNKTSGSTAGGDVVTITGTNFTAASAVSFGDTPATQFLVTSDTSIVATAPGGADGTTVDVSVTTGGGTSTLSTADQFTYQTPVATGGTGGTGTSPSPLPTVTGLSVGNGSIAGGETVVISGTNFAGTTAVFFGSVAAASFDATSDGEITAIAPAVGQVSNLPETVDITVQNLDGTSALVTADEFTFNTPANPPTVTALSTAAGSTTGGAQITITGTNFSDVTGVSFVLPPTGSSPAISLAAASFQIVSPTEIVAVAPPDTGDIPDGTPVDVEVTTTGGTSAPTAADEFTFSSQAPLVTGLSASSGFTTGGDTINISGVNLDGATAVFFGSVAAASFTINDDGTITAVVPAASISPPSQGGAGGGVGWQWHRRSNIGA